MLPRGSANSLEGVGTSFEEDNSGKNSRFSNPLGGAFDEENAQRGRTSPGAGIAEAAGVLFENDTMAAAPDDAGSRSPSPLALRKSKGKSVSEDLDAPAEHVVPESLETDQGDEQVEVWKETLVQHVIQGKENDRDKRRREAASVLQQGSLIDPNGRFRRRWDMVQIALLIYVAFGVPYRLGFSDSVVLWSAWFWFDAVVDIYFVSDLVVSFKTAFYNEKGELVVDAKEIRQNYYRTWFIVDISSCFPGNYISYAMDDQGGRSSRMIKLLRMLRLLKLLRLARLNRLIRRYEEEFASLMTTFKLAKLVVLIIVVGHWLSCLFFGIGNMERDPAMDFGIDTQGEEMVGWVARHFNEERCGPGHCRLQKYMTSFYWAVMTMTTVGYGDIVPNTKYEMAACIVSMIIGGFIFGSIVGNLAELSKRANAGELMRQKAVSKVQIVLSSGVARGVVSPDLVRRIKSHYRFTFERNTALDINNFILRLPPDLRDEMAEQIHWIDGVYSGRETFGLLHKIPFLSGLSNTASVTICAGLNVIHLTPPSGQTEVVMKEGADCEEMYIVIEGNRSIILEREGTQLGGLSTGDFFGELGALLPPEMKHQRRRTRSAYATGETQLGCLTYDDLLKLRRDSFEINEKVVEYTNQVLGHLEPGADGAVSTVSLLDTHPELRLLEKKIDQLLDQRANTAAVTQALPKEKQAEILKKNMQSLAGGKR